MFGFGSGGLRSLRSLTPPAPTPSPNASLARRTYSIIRTRLRRLGGMTLLTLLTALTGIPIGGEHAVSWRRDTS